MKELIKKPRVLIMTVLTVLLVMLHNISFMAGILIEAGVIFTEFMDKGD